MNEQGEKSDDLSERIRQAEAGIKSKQPEDKSGPSRNAGFDFVGSVLGGGVVGALLDRVFGTWPWCLLGMVVLGFIAGMMSAWRGMQGK